MARQVAISAGEASGDASGAHLALEMRKLAGDLEFWGGGGARMRSAGVDTIIDPVGGSIGVFESLKIVPGLLAKYVRLRREILSRRPDVFVPIDFGAFNPRLAKFVYERGVRVVYYFPPSSWRKKTRNAERLAKCGGRVVTPFPWSAENLTDAGLQARFVGHPLVDIARPNKKKEDFCAEHSLHTNSPIIGLLPGSRSHEITRHMSPMLAAAKLIEDSVPDTQFVVACGQNAALVEKMAASVHNSPGVLRIVRDATYDCMAHSDFLMATSGTATLEAAIIGTPMLIVYRGTSIMRFEYLFRKGVLEGNIGMPNILYGEEICPEFLGEDVNAENLAETAMKYTSDKYANDKMRSDLASVREMLGGPGSLERAARAVMELGEISPDGDM